MLLEELLLDDEEELELLDELLLEFDELLLDDDELEDELDEVLEVELLLEELVELELAAGLSSEPPQAASPAHNTPVKRQSLKNLNRTMNDLQSMFVIGRAA